MIRIGIDTSVLIGLLDPKDVWHARAVRLKQATINIRAEVAVFDCVLAEAISTMARRIYEQRRVQDLELLLKRVERDYPEDDILWLLPDVPLLYVEIIEIVRASAGALNFNDALIALSCRQREIPFLASFDRDFDALPWLQRIAQPEDLP
jgi:predicted nucleic acid-binding protein